MTSDARQLIDSIGQLCQSPHLSGRTINIMEVCGTHTMSIARSGLKSVLPKNLRLISGPGCPVCVTDQSFIDQAIALAADDAKPIIATYGDMIRVPGSHGSLANARSDGADVRVVYSADQAVQIAADNADRQVVFLALGFETTTPATALAILRASEEKIANFSILAAHKTIMPAMMHLCKIPDVRIDAFLCPGHVAIIIGWGVFEQIVSVAKTPCAVAGFEPAQILSGIFEIVRMLYDNSPAAMTVYPPATREGNIAAADIIAQVFEPCDAQWRAIGTIPGSGLRLREQFRTFDALTRFKLAAPPAEKPSACKCGMVITGRIAPHECPLFASACTPTNPIGPCMVSSEGACAAAFKYERNPRRNVAK